MYFLRLWSGIALRTLILLAGNCNRLGWWGLPTEGKASGRHAPPDTANPAKAEISAPLGPGIEPEMWRHCSKQFFLRSCGRFCGASHVR